MKFNLDIFLLTSATADRITSLLVKNGFGVAPGFSDGTLTATHMASTPCCMVIEGKEDIVSIEVGKKLSQLFRDAKIPYYGFILHSTQGGADYVSSGFLPEIKKSSEPIPPGPTKNNGNVIPFPDKKNEPN